MRLKKMQMITIQVTDSAGVKALQSLQEQGHIKFIDKKTVKETALPGPPMSLKEFRAWIADAEKSPTISLKEAKRKWAAKRKLLLKLAESGSPKKPKKV